MPSSDTKNHLGESRVVGFHSPESLTNMLHKSSSSQTYINGQTFARMVTCVQRKISSLFKCVCFVIKSDSSDGSSGKSQGHEGHMMNRKEIKEHCAFLHTVFFRVLKCFINHKRMKKNAVNVYKCIFTTGFRTTSTSLHVLWASKRQS